MIDAEFIELMNMEIDGVLCVQVALDDEIKVSAHATPSPNCRG